jgi:hypothetical protein
MRNQTHTMIQATWSFKAFWKCCSRRHEDGMALNSAAVRVGLSSRCRMEIIQQARDWKTRSPPYENKEVMHQLHCL